MTAPLPLGWRVELDRNTRRLDARTLFGGSPARILALSEAGRRALAELEAGPIVSAAGAALARRLTDAGAAHPRPPACPDTPSLTVVIPVRDRAGLLAGCLAALGDRYPVVVVDDGSRDPDAVRAVCSEHGATVVTRPVNGGPAAARNDGLDVVDTEFVALLDSDCVPTQGWIEPLLAHLADPEVAAVAPRIVARARPNPGWAWLQSEANGSLDLGSTPARVAPGRAVSYVPNSALVARTCALRIVASDSGRPFDESLRVGEDVDLVWRLDEHGWRVRYAPEVTVAHHEPATLAQLLRRRHGYGTSAGPLARRHPAAMAPLALHLWPALTVLCLLTRRPLAGALTFGVSVYRMRVRLRRAGLPVTGVTPAMARATQQTWLGMGRYLTQFFLPLLLAGACRSRHRLGWLSLLLGPPATLWLTRRPRLDLARFTLGQVADDVSYGSGVWRSAVTSRTVVPLRPTLVVRPLGRASSDRVETVAPSPTAPDPVDPAPRSVRKL